MSMVFYGIIHVFDGNVGRLVMKSKGSLQYLAAVSMFA